MPTAADTQTVYWGEWIVRTDASGNKVAFKIDNLDRVVFITEKEAALVGVRTPSKGMIFEFGPFNILVKVWDVAGMRWNKVTVSVTFDNVTHGFRSLLQLFFITQRRVGIAADLLRPFFRLCHDSTSIADGLVKAGVGLFVDVFGFLFCG